MGFRLAGLILVCLGIAASVGCTTTVPGDADESPPISEEGAGPALEDSDVIPVADSPVRGSGDAWVTVVVFADFQCPFSARLAANLDAVEDSLDDGIMRVVFKHYPLSDHRGAFPAAVASQAAHRQGKFWQMHDALFDNVGRLRSDDPMGAIIEIAAGLDIDLHRLQRDMERRAVVDRVDADRRLAGELGIADVPVVFVNGGYIDGARAPEVYEEAVRDMYEVLQRGVEEGQIERSRVYRDSVDALYSHTRPKR